jgi:hypothetical protein
MADNYLEKKMEEFRSGKRVVRRPSASLESLLSQIADAPDGAGSVAGAAESAVMPAQLEAIVRAGKRLPEAAGFRFETDSVCISGKSSAPAAVIRVLGPSSPRRYVFEAGEVLLAMRLKAAELHLRSSFKFTPELSAPANPLLFTLSVFK